MSITGAEIDHLYSRLGHGRIPDGAITETMARRQFTTGTFQPVSGTLTMWAIFLASNQLVTSINFVSGATAESGGSHLWYALYSETRQLLKQSTDNTGATAFAANTSFKQNLSAPFLTTYSGIYYIGFCAVATTMPSLMTQFGSSVINGLPPILSGTSTTGLTNVAPASAAALTAIADTAYAYVS